MQVAAALSLTALLCPDGESKVRRTNPSTSYNPAKLMCYASAQMEYRVERTIGFFSRLCPHASPLLT
jgi:hypothetical protein